MLKKILLSLAAGLCIASFASADVVKTPYRPIETIFEADSVTISGRIAGYDPGSGPKVLQLTVNDLALGRTTPIALPVKPDGSFGRRFLLPMAQLTYITDGGPNKIDVYLEPNNYLTFCSTMKNGLMSSPMRWLSAAPWAKSTPKSRPVR